MKSSAKNYVIQAHSEPADIDASAWDALLDAQAEPTPFLHHAYLLALHRSNSAVPDAGWAPVFLTLHQGGALQAACALYLKSHSYGEYVFDWAWAEAYRRHGLPYYPKLLGAVPFTPVPGARLLALSEASRDLLLQAVLAFAQQQSLSSAHLLFLAADDRAAIERATGQGWMLREGVQFHWNNRSPEPYADFNDFLRSLQREKRKKIAQERRRVGEAGVTFEVRLGDQITAADWDFFYRCYTL
ncbi:MAG: peptidogalycan biosysnthesis protein, partial [Burkholderiaceae bacterium]